MDDMEKLEETFDFRKDNGLEWIEFDPPQEMLVWNDDVSEGRFALVVAYDPISRFPVITGEGRFRHCCSMKRRIRTWFRGLKRGWENLLLLPDKVYDKIEDIGRAYLGNRFYDWCVAPIVWTIKGISVFLMAMFCLGGLYFWPCLLISFLKDFK